MVRAMVRAGAVARVRAMVRAGAVARVRGYG